MYIEQRKYGKKGQIQYLIRESYREGEKVKKRTLCNVSHLTNAQRSTLLSGLKAGKEQETLLCTSEEITTEQGVSIGATLLLFEIAKRLGIEYALGKERAGKLALWQVMARIIDQGSRLSATRLIKEHHVTSFLGFSQCQKNELYENLNYLADHQAEIEDRLFEYRNKGEKLTLCLYDVTSSYLEGMENELAQYGYNRDKKKGKMQIVIGLLCDQEGVPVSIQVFEGNTGDTSTVSDQIEKIAKRFGAPSVVMVGDRGMLKGPQREELEKKGFSYITAIGKPQVEKLIREKILQMSLFDSDLKEVEYEGIRYVYRRNPIRMEEIRSTRREKEESFMKWVEKQNTYLKEHSKANPALSLQKGEEKREHLNISWVSLSINTENEREILIGTNTEEKEELEILDGCYVIISDVPKSIMTAETLHTRYKDLAHVEWAFRTSKMDFLEIRPLFVRKEKRTRGHALVVMLAYRMVQELQRLWKDIDMTVQEGIHALSSLCETRVYIGGEKELLQIPKPRPSLQMLFSKAHISVPSGIPFDM